MRRLSLFSHRPLLFHRHLLISLLSAATASLATGALGATLRVPEQYSTIQAAIDQAASGDEVVVAAGSYSGPGNRDIDFLGKAIVVRAEDAAGAGATVIECGGSESEPHRGVLFVNGEANDSVLRGFTIRGGVVRGEWPDGDGGGIFLDGASPLIEECVIRDNSADFGAGISCTNGASPRIRRCDILNNDALESGGGSYNWYLSSPLITHCVFRGNHAGFGAGLYLREEIEVHNCIIEENVADYYGGGIRCADFSAPHLSNCTIRDNSAYLGGGVYASSFGDPTIDNSIIWGNGPEEIYNYAGNCRFSYSDIRGGWSGEGNIDADPHFVSYRGFAALPGPGSPCIDSGDPDVTDQLYDDLPAWPEFYPDGPRCDMGAYGGGDNGGWLAR